MTAERNAVQAERDRSLGGMQAFLGAPVSMPLDALKSGARAAGDTALGGFVGRGTEMVEDILGLTGSIPGELMNVVSPPYPAEALARPGPRMQPPPQSLLAQAAGSSPDLPGSFAPPPAPGGSPRLEALGVAGKDLALLGAALHPVTRPLAAATMMTAPAAALAGNLTADVPDPSQAGADLADLTAGGLLARQSSLAPLRGALPQGPRRPLGPEFQIPGGGLPPVPEPPPPAPPQPPAPQLALPAAAERPALTMGPGYNVEPQRTNLLPEAPAGPRGESSIIPGETIRLPERPRPAFEMRPEPPLLPPGTPPPTGGTVAPQPRPEVQINRGTGEVSDPGLALGQSIALDYTPNVDPSQVRFQQGPRPRPQAPPDFVDKRSASIPEPPPPPAPPAYPRLDQAPGGSPRTVVQRPAEEPTTYRLPQPPAPPPPPPGELNLGTSGRRQAARDLETGRPANPRPPPQEPLPPEPPPRPDIIDGEFERTIIEQPAEFEPIAGPQEPITARPFSPLPEPPPPPPDPGGGGRKARRVRYEDDPAAYEAARRQVLRDSEASPEPGPRPPAPARREEGAPDPVFVEPKVQPGRKPVKFRILRDIASEYPIDATKGLDSPGEAVTSRVSKPQFSTSVFNRTRMTQRRAESTRLINELERRALGEMGFTAADEAMLREAFDRNPEAFALFDKLRAGEELTPEERAFRESHPLADRVYQGYDAMLDEADAMDVGFDKGSLGPGYFPRESRTLGQKLKSEPPQSSSARAEATMRSGEKVGGNIRKSRVGSDFTPTNPAERMQSYRRQLLTEIVTNKEIRDIHAAQEQWRARGDVGMVDNANDWIRRNIKGEIGQLDQAVAAAQKTKLIDPAQVKVGLEFPTEGKLDGSVKGNVAVISQRSGRAGPEYRITVDGRMHPGEFTANELIAMRHENTVLDSRPASRWVGKLNALGAGLALIGNFRPAVRAGADNVGRVLAENSMRDVTHGVRQLKRYFDGTLDEPMRQRWADSEFMKNDLEQLTQYPGHRGDQLTLADSIKMPANVPDFLARPIAYEATYQKLRRAHPEWTPSQLKTETAVRAARMVDLKNSYTSALAEGTIGGAFFGFLKNASARKWQQVGSLISEGDFVAASKVIGIPAAILYGAYKSVGGDARDVLQAVSDLPFLQVAWDGTARVPGVGDVPAPSDVKVAWPAQLDIAKRTAAGVGNLAGRLAAGEETTAADWLGPMGSGPSQIGAALMGKPQALVLGGRDNKPEAAGDAAVMKGRRREAYLERKRRERDRRGEKK